MRTNDDGAPAEGGLDPHLEAAHDALEAGRPEHALAEAAASPDAEGRVLLEVRAHLLLGHLEAARGALERAAALIGEEDLDVLELTGELAFSSWNLETARRAFVVVLEDGGDEDSFLLERLALLADLEGEEAAADELMTRALAADPERTNPVHLTDEAFDHHVEAALDSLDPRFRAALENTRVIREPVPFKELVDPSHPGETPPDILGLFVGATIHDTPAEAELPPTIYLFKRNLERMARDEAHLAEEIRITLFHEIGHLLGLDEDEVASMGLA